MFRVIFLCLTSQIDEAFDFLRKKKLYNSLLNTCQLQSMYAVLSVLRAELLVEFCYRSKKMFGVTPQRGHLPLDD